MTKMTSGFYPVFIVESQGYNKVERMLSKDMGYRHAPGLSCSPSLYTQMNISQLWDLHLDHEKRDWWFLFS
ncbi:hypothetical protein ACQP3J_32115, partial [Escherichia coli]